MAGRQPSTTGLRDPAHPPAKDGGGLDPLAFEPDRVRDACGILGGLTPRPRPLARFVEMVSAMAHRGGDGLGVHFRLPHEVLEAEIEGATYRASDASRWTRGTGPLVLTLQVPDCVAHAQAVAWTRGVLERHGLGLVYARPVSRPTRDAEAVRTWRFVAEDVAPDDGDRLARRVSCARRELEARSAALGLPPSFHPVSFSRTGMVLYKLVGTIDDWVESFGGEPLAHIRTDCFIAHVRYSTNTLPRHRSAQPFGFLAHNGEINNIGAVRRAMRDFGLAPSAALSDSSDVDSIVEELCERHDLELTEALRLLFPDRWLLPGADEAARAWHRRLGRAARPVRAEGPAAVVASDGRTLVGRLDSLGLRPLTLVTTRAEEVFFASEPGAVAPLEDVERIQRLRPGEMIAAVRSGSRVRLLGEAELSARMRARRGGGTATRGAQSKRHPLPAPVGEAAVRSSAITAPTSEHRRAAAGYPPRVRRQLEALFLEGIESGSGTGWRGGLAVARGPGIRLADVFQSMIAQVTAPTISAEHEMAAMDGRVVLGTAPSLGLAPGGTEDPAIALALPLVLGDEGVAKEEAAMLREAAARLDVESLHGLRERAGSQLAEIDARIAVESEVDRSDGAERIRSDLDRLCEEAAAHAEAGEGSVLLLRADPLDGPGATPLPPELAVGAVDHDLTRRGLRRRVSLLVASDAISDPHSQFVLLQLGADALVPTLLGEEGLALARRKGRDPVETLERGVRAIARALFVSYGRIATGEIAAGRGGRRLCAVGLDDELVDRMGVGSRLGSGHGLGDLWESLQLRARALSGEPDSLGALEEEAVDTMPLDVSLAGYALLGGFEPSPGRTPRSPGQRRVAMRTLESTLARAGSPGGANVVPPPPGDVARDAASLLEWVRDLPVDRLSELHEQFYAPLRAGAHGFLDSLELAGSDEAGVRDWKSVGSGIDGRRTNQILGAISYGANNRVVHELYALVMARSGAMSNGGEGGVPDHVRALFVTARLAARGASPRALDRQLALEVPGCLEQLDEAQREAHCRRLLQTVPEDFAASRFEQISTARFGVDAYALHDARLLEIKIGQGAKPGVGGSLPGAKVLAPIAATRGVNVGQTLNSPTVHHDIYSIEDLRQLVTALKTLRRDARVCVKLAAMDDLDVIALGVVKAGADFIWIDGYEGGTGSAKDAHKEHCGLPAAPVVRRVHEALVDQGMRGSYRELDGEEFLTRREFHRLAPADQGRFRWWGPRIIASGGVRSAQDAVKLLAAGAEYVGYGDAAQNAVGCIRCERCQTGSCPSYVATNDPARSEAFDAASGDTTLTKFVELLDVGMRRLGAQLVPGLRNLEELVGRTDLLRPVDHAALRVDARFFEPVEERDPGAARSLDPARDVSAARRAAARRLEDSFEAWRGDVRADLAEQGLDVADPNALAEVTPGEIQLQSGLRRLEVDVPVDNRDRLLGTGVVTDFVALRRLVALATGEALELSLRAEGAAGNGFGMFAVDGMDLTLVGSGGDYLGEAVNGARIFVLPAIAGSGGLLSGSGDAGSASVYGMRGGEVHLFDQPGVRFGIRLSGGSVFVWGDGESVEASFARDRVKPRFTGEYMTRGTLVLCRDPGYDLLCAATGRDTEILCRKPAAAPRSAWAHELARRIPDAFEVTELDGRHVELIERGARAYQQRAHDLGIPHAVTPLEPGEDVRATFHLVRERRDSR